MSASAARSMQKSRRLRKRDDGCAGAVPLLLTFPTGKSAYGSECERKWSLTFAARPLTEANRLQAWVTAAHAAS